MSEFVKINIISIALLCSVTMQARQKADDRFYDFDKDTVELGQVVVTGTRTPKTLAATPVPTRIVTSKDIERVDATDIQDLLKQELPGAEFSYAMNQQTHLNISGFGGQSILFLVDGERLAGETMDDVDFNRLTMAGVERIEIVKGAASALYGSNAGGGVINIITHESSKPWSLHVDSRWGSHHSHRYNGMFSVNKKHWSNSLTATYSQIDNYHVSNADNPITRVYHEVYGNKVISVKDQFVVRPTEQLKLKGKLGYYFRQVPRVPSEPERYRDFSAGLKAEWEMSRNDHVELSYAFDQYDKSTFLKAQSLDIRSYSNVQNSVRALYNHSFSNGDILTLGGDVMRDYLLNTKLMGTERTQQSVDVFTQFDWNINSKWEMVTALRYDYFSDGHLSRIIPKLSLRYQPKCNLSVRLGYGMGFRAPTLKEKYYEFDMAGIWIVEGNEQLKPELSHNFNASVEYTKGRYNLMVMGYYNSVKDKISTGIPYYRSKENKQLYLPYGNMDSYAVYGVDVSVCGRWDIITAKLGYAYVKEQLPKSGDVSSVNNQYIPARPHSLNWEVGLDKSFSNDYSLSVTLSGRMLSAVENKEYRDYYDVSQGTISIHYPAYSLWKLMAVQRLWNKAKLSLTIDNLFNYKPDYYYFNAPTTDGLNMMVGLGIDLD